jgi:GTPase SAR1 family protein
MILVGNKCDLENKREVEASVGKDTAKNWGIPFLETSAKKDINIQVCKTFIFRSY